MTAEGSMNKRTSFSVKDRCVIQSLYSHATLPRVSIHFVPVAGAPDALTGP